MASDAVMAMPGCDPTHTVPVTVTFPGGNQIETTWTCDLEGVDVTYRPDGGADVECNYGDCGTQQL